MNKRQEAFKLGRKLEYPDHEIREAFGRDPDSTVAFLRHKFREQDPIRKREIKKLSEKLRKMFYRINYFHPCSICGAKKGMICRTPDGKPYHAKIGKLWQSEHMTRTDPGYLEAKRRVDAELKRHGIEF